MGSERMGVKGEKKYLRVGREKAIAGAESSVGKFRSTSEGGASNTRERRQLGWNKKGQQIRGD